MNVTNTIKGVVNATKYTVTAPIIKEDYGLYLKIEGLDLPTVYEVDFSNSERSGSSVTMVGNSDGVLIPRQFIKSGQDVFAFLYWTGEDFGRTVYKFRIPNKLRPDRTEEQPTPEEQSLIDQAISALNTAVEQTAADVETTTAKVAEATSAAATATQKASEATESAQAAGTYATRAETAQNASESARDTATAKATAAATSAENASGSAVNALDSASDAAISAGQASASAIAAGQSALDARDYKDAANLSAESASGYAGSASYSATTATEQATIATNKASESAQSALDASTAKDDAVTAKTAAETAQTAAETAQGLAEDAQTGAETAQAAAEAVVYTKADGIVDIATGAVASFPDGADDFPMKSLKVAIDPVQDLHGYEKPWPAGGGKNLFDPDSAVNGYIDDVTGELKPTTNPSKSTDYIAVTPSTSYYIISAKTSGNWGAWYDDNKEYISGLQFLAGTTARLVTSPATAQYVRFTVSYSGNNPDYATNVMIAQSSTEIPYEPYSNICPISGWSEVNVWVKPTYDPTANPTVTLQLGQTVYGGTLDVVGGVLTQRMYYYKPQSMDDIVLYSDDTTHKLYRTASFQPLSLNNYGGSNPKCSFTDNFGNAPSHGTVPIVQFPNSSSQGNIYFRITADMNPLDCEFVYELAEPITYHLTPTEVRTLLGQNNVWADTGDSTVEYYADTKRYIDKRIAEIVN